eukprot:12301483-Alexandrium_andersonii.AAC.1
MRACKDKPLRVASCRRRAQQLRVFVCFHFSRIHEGVHLLRRPWQMTAASSPARHTGAAPATPSRRTAELAASP